MIDQKRMDTSRRKPRAAKCVREKLTDRIVAWMNQQLRQGEPNHFARDVAKAMGCSVGSAAQGLFFLFCHGRVTKTAARGGNASIYGLTAKGRGQS